MHNTSLQFQKAHSPHKKRMLLPLLQEDRKVKGKFLSLYYRQINEERKGNQRMRSGIRTLITHNIRH